MISHAFSSSGLFILVTILYNRNRSRIIKYFRGIANQMPVFACLFLLFTLANISFPGTMNFIGEILIFLGFLQNFKMITILVNLSVILSACYSLFLYNRIVFGVESLYLINLNRDLTRSEIYNLLPLLVCCLLMGLNTNFLTLLEIPTKNPIFIYVSFK